VLRYFQDPSPNESILNFTLQLSGFEPCCIPNPPQCGANAHEGDLLFAVSAVCSPSILAFIRPRIRFTTSPKNDGRPKQSNAASSTILDTSRSPAKIRNLPNAEPQEGESVRWSDQIQSAERTFGPTGLVENIAARREVSQ